MPQRATILVVRTVLASTLLDTHVARQHCIHGIRLRRSSASAPRAFSFYLRICRMRRGTLLELIKTENETHYQKTKKTQSNQCFQIQLSAGSPYRLVLFVRFAFFFLRSSHFRLRPEHRHQHAIPIVFGLHGGGYDRQHNRAILRSKVASNCYQVCSGNMMFAVGFC